MLTATHLATMSLSSVQAFFQSLQLDIPILETEANTATVARKSLVAARDLEAGIVLREDMLSALRPGTGLPPSRMDEVLGRRLLRRVAAGAQIHPTHLE